MLRIAAVLLWVQGLGFGAYGVVGAAYFHEHHQVWGSPDYPSYGDGPFVSWGVPNSTELILAFVVVCAVEVLDGVLLWLHRPAGRWLSWALLPVEMTFWIGFALPFGPPGGIARVVLVEAGVRRARARTTTA